MSTIELPIMLRRSSRLLGKGDYRKKRYVLLVCVESPSDPLSGEGACPDKGKSAPSKVGGSGGGFKFVKSKATPVASSGRLGRQGVSARDLELPLWVAPCHLVRVHLRVPRYHLLNRRPTVARNRLLATSPLLRLGLIMRIRGYS